MGERDVPPTEPERATEWNLGQRKQEQTMQRREEEKREQERKEAERREKAKAAPVSPEEGRPHTKYSELAEEATTGRPIPDLERE